MNRGRPPDWRRVGGKDYGWVFGIPGVVIVEAWYPPSAEGWTLPWSEDARDRAMQVMDQAEFPALFRGTQRPVRCGELPESAFETIGNILADTSKP